MASEPSGAIINFPTGTDIYVTKTDFGVIVSGESHTIPFVSPYVVSLTHVPQLGNPSLVSIPGFTEVTGNPGVNQFQITYSGTGAGNGLFSAFNAGNPISVTYTTAGDTIRSEWFNSLQTSVVNIENFIGSGLGISGNYVPITGATINGTITLNGANLFTSSSGNNQVGSSASPFASIYANTLVGQILSSPNGLNTVSFGGSVTISGDGSASLISNGAVVVSGHNTATIIAKESGVTILSDVAGVSIAGHTVPTASSTFDLGSTTNRWGKVYADEVTITSGPFVLRSGDTMTGPLVMSTGGSINTDTINNASSNLSINSSANIDITAVGDIAVNSNSTDLNGVLTANSFGTILNATIVPNTPSVVDIGDASTPFRNLYVDNIVGANLSGNFVRISGDTMTGDLTMGFGAAINVDNINSASPSGLLTVSVGELHVQAGNNIHFDTGPSGTQRLEIGLTEISLSSDIIPTTSGLYDIGAASLPLRAIYADNLILNSLSSGTVLNNPVMGNVTVTGNLTMSGNILSAGSGLANIGSSGTPFGTLYVNSIVTSESTGNFISKFGDTMIGTLTLGTGSSIAAVGSGVNNIGSLSNPMGTIYASNIVSTGLDGQYVKKTGDTMSGPLVLNTIYSTGTLTISGNQIDESAEQINITSTNGPIILDANTELQMLVNAAANIALNVSGTESFKDFYPEASGVHSLGTPQRPWESIYALNIIPVGTSGTGNFVLKIGDTMVGNLNFSSGIGITLSNSGTSDIGTPSSPLRAVYADNLVITSPTGGYVHVTGDTMTGDLTFDNANITALGPFSLQAVTDVLSFLGQDGISSTSNADYDITAGSGRITQIATGISITATITDIALQAATQVTSQVGGYSTVVSSSGVNLNGASGELIAVSGSAVKIQAGGSVNFRSTNTENIFYKNVVPSGSGTVLIGTAASPFSGAFFQNINGEAATRQVYNEIPPEFVDGLTTTFTTVNTMVSGTQRVYRGGMRMSPGALNDYQFSGNMITFNVAPPTGTNILIDYERLAF